MFNLGAQEVLVILLLALIVLGPQRMPDAAKQIGRMMGEMRKLSSGFQQELRTAFDAETEAKARANGAAAVAAPEPTAQPVAGRSASTTSATPSTPARPARTPAARPKRSQPLRAPSSNGTAAGSRGRSAR